MPWRDYSQARTYLDVVCRALAAQLRTEADVDFVHAAAGSPQLQVHMKPEVIYLHPVQYAKLGSSEGPQSSR